jgi:hypothetical protein
MSPVTELDGSYIWQARLSGVFEFTEHELDQDPPLVILEKLRTRLTEVRGTTQILADRLLYEMQKEGGVELNEKNA